MLVDDFLPIYDVSDAVAAVVRADLARTWDALMEVDLIEVGRRHPMVGLLGALRTFPDVVGHVLHGEGLPDPPKSLRLRDLSGLPMNKGGWVLLGERRHDEIALGLVGKFWRPVIEFAAVPTADAFRVFDTPGFARTVYSLAVRPLEDGGTLLTGTMRTATTDERARAWFRRYWTFGVGSGAHVLVGALLDVTRDNAEASR